MGAIKLTRYFSNEELTLGILRINGSHAPIYTLELPWRANMKDVSCIPEGEYKLQSYTSKEHKNVFRVYPVKNREGILIHVGNYPSNSNGCILPGLSVFPAQKMVSQSTQAMELIRKLLGQDTHYLTIERLT